MPKDVGGRSRNGRRVRCMGGLGRCREALRNGRRVRFMDGLVGGRAVKKHLL
jgi:hypothetical protein